MKVNTRLSNSLLISTITHKFFTQLYHQVSVCIKFSKVYWDCSCTSVASHLPSVTRVLSYQPLCHLILVYDAKGKQWRATLTPIPPIPPPSTLIASFWRGCDERLEQAHSFERSPCRVCAEFAYLGTVLFCSSPQRCRKSSIRCLLDG